MQLQFGGARESQIFGRQYSLFPNLELYKPMVLVIVSLLSLLCALHSFLGSSNKLLYFNNKLSMSLTLYPSKNHNVYGVYQILPKNKVS